MMSSFQVHVVDRDTRRRAEISFTLTQGLIQTQVYESIHELIRFVPTSGLVLLNTDDDLSLSELNLSLMAGGEYMPVAVYSAKPDVRKVVDAILSGALDFLEWPFSSHEVQAAIARIASRSVNVAQAERNRVHSQALVARLSPREKEILVHMVAGHSNKTTGLKLGISSRTVEIHRANVTDKLAARSSADAVRIGLYAGLDSNGPDSSMPRNEPTHRKAA